MSYVRDSLGDGEEILMMGKFPWPYHLVAWGALILLGIIGIGIIIWAWMLIHFNVTESAVTTRRVVNKKGLWRRETQELGISTVEQVELRQSIWGRILGYGVLEISGTGEGRIATHPVAQPIRFRKFISDARDEAKRVRVARDDPALANR